MRAICVKWTQAKQQSAVKSVTSVLSKCRHMRSVLCNWTRCTNSEFIFLPPHWKEKDRLWTSAAGSIIKNISLIHFGTQFRLALTNQVVYNVTCPEHHVFEKQRRIVAVCLFVSVIIYYKRNIVQDNVVLSFHCYIPIDYSRCLLYRRCRANNFFGIYSKGILSTFIQF